MASNFVRNDIREVIRDEVSRLLSSNTPERPETINSGSRPPSSGSSRHSTTTASISSAPTPAFSSTETFEEFYRRREVDRQQGFQPAKKKMKVTSSKSIAPKYQKCGGKSWSHNSVRWCLQNRRGKTHVVSVSPSASKEELIEKAVLKHSSFDQTFDDSTRYTLLYPDFREVDVIPGTTDKFTLCAYKQAIGKDYKRLTFSLIPEDELSGTGEESDADHSEPTDNSFWREGFSTSLTSHVNLISHDDLDLPPCPWVKNEDTAGPSRVHDTDHDDANHDLPPADFASQHSHEYSRPASSTQSQNFKTSSEYNSYVSLLEDEEDTDFLTAIELSLKEYSAVSENTNVEDSPDVENVAEILKGFVEKNLKHNSQPSIIIRRQQVYKSTIRAIKRDNFSFFKPVQVVFSAEEAVDTGGPKREFLRLLMREISVSSIFNGAWLSHDVGLLNTKQYELAGKLVAWSILQGGPGPQCMSESAFQLMQGYHADKECLIEDVADYELKTILEDIDKCDTEAAFNETVTKHSDAIANFGYTKIYLAKFEQKADIIECLLKQNYIFAVHAALHQFENGMNSIGKFGDLAMKNKGVFKAILGKSEEKLTCTMFKSLYKVNFSEKGSNKRDDEEKTMYSFEIFLQDLDQQVNNTEGVGCQELLIFITGADVVPPLGFDYSMTIEFYTSTENDKRLPYASTCSMTLYLPRGVEEPDVFAALMKRSLLECHGFGKF